MKKLSENMTIAVSFLAGIIFYNAVVSLLSGQYEIAFMSFVALIVAFSVLKYTNWEASI
ncbi:MAG TPA: hypothetical protein VJB11_00355 [archaeon]|nr:hypothetical protein [archaeon]